MTHSSEIKRFAFYYQLRRALNVNADSPETNRFLDANGTAAAASGPETSRTSGLLGSTRLLADRLGQKAHDSRTNCMGTKDRSTKEKLTTVDAARSRDVRNIGIQNYRGVARNFSTGIQDKNLWAHGGINGFQLFWNKDLEVCD